MKKMVFYGKIHEKSNLSSVRKVFKRAGMGKSFNNCNNQYTSIMNNFGANVKVKLIVEEISSMEWISGAYGSGVALL